MCYDQVELNPNADVRVYLNAIINFYNTVTRHAAFLATRETPRTSPRLDMWLY